MTDEDNERKYDTVDGKATNIEHSKVIQTVTTTTFPPTATGRQKTQTVTVVEYE